MVYGLRLAHDATIKSVILKPFVIYINHMTLDEICTDIKKTAIECGADKLEVKFYKNGTYFNNTVPIKANSFSQVNSNEG